MPRRTLLMAMVFFVFTHMGCRETEQKGHPILPSLHISISPKDLDSILASQDNKVPAIALLIDASGDTLYQGDLTHIKTRGNTTFKEPKKSFTIKFPKKQHLFGLNKSKSFILLANATDESFIRNAIGLDLAQACGIPASRYAYLTLYINNSYTGLYQMTNKVDIGKDALNITDLEQLNKEANPKALNEYEWYGRGRKKQAIQRKGVLLDKSPDDITGGYLLDNSGPVVYYSKSISGFVSDANDNLRIRSPQHSSPQEVDYIAERYNEMESAILAIDGIHPKTGKHYSEYIDIESFAHYYLLNEILMNWDGGWTSFMMYKDIDSKSPKIHAGPAWDFDRTLNNPIFLENKCYSFNEFYVNGRKGKVGFAHSGGLLHHLCKHEDFQQEVKKCYLNEISPALHSYLAESSFDSLVSLLSHEADQDNQMYGTRHSKDYKTATARATDFLRKRIDFFDWYFSSKEGERVLVHYTPEKGKDRKFYYPLGEVIVVPQIEALYNHTPVYELFYAGTDSLVTEGTVFLSGQNLEIREREPTKREVQIRRIRKKLVKIGIIKD